MTPFFPGKAQLEQTDRVFLVALAAFLGAIAFSLAGSVLLRVFPGPAGDALAWFAANLDVTLGDLIRWPTWVFMGLMPVLSFLLYRGALGPRRSLAFLVWGSCVGAAAELSGTMTGFPFGEYAYGDLLGAKIAGHVPWLIPPSWYAMSIVCFDLAGRLRLPSAGRIVTTALFMVLWDVALDPAMNHAFPFWSYPDGGFFFGMPLSNWGGWIVASLVIAWGYEKLLGGSEEQAIWAPTLWSVNVLFPLALCFLYETVWAVPFGLAALAVPFAAIALRNRSAG